MLEISSCSAGYAGRQALSSVSLSLAPGTAGCVLGPSGCGKTTLLMVAAGLKAPDAGGVTVGGEPVRAGDPRVGLILQDYGLFPWFTALDNVAVGHRIRGRGRHESRRRGLATLARFGLAHKADSYPGALSGGERQRVAIARAVTLGPSVLLMDEPFSALDAMTREDLQDLLVATVGETGLSVLMVTHSIEEAAFVGHTIWVLSEAPGRLVDHWDNPGQGGRGFRSDPAFFRTCTALRTMLRGAGTRARA